jgi:excisionase family DNA binding protein
MPAETSNARLLPLDEAVAPYRGVNVRMARRWIAAGRLPATKVGRGYLVSPDDVAALLRPTLREPKARLTRESESVRIARQLAEAGIR